MNKALTVFSVLIALTAQGCCTGDAAEHPGASVDGADDSPDTSVPPLQDVNDTVFLQYPMMSQSEVLSLRLGTPYADVYAMLQERGAAMHLDIPILYIGAREGGSYWLLFYDVDREPGKNTGGLTAVVYFPPGAVDTAIFVSPPSKAGRWIRVETLLHGPSTRQSAN